MKIKNTLIGISFLLLTACASHIGTVGGNATITNNEFQIIGLAIGESSTQKIFGIGGLKNEALLFNAKKNLYHNYPLAPGQALTNITVDFKKENYLIYSTTKVILTAEIVDFNTLNSNKNVNDYTINKRFNYHKQDTVLFKTNNKYQSGIISKLSLNNAVIQHIDTTQQEIKSYTKLYKNIFTKQGDFQYKNEKYFIGDSITIDIKEEKINIEVTSSTLSGTVIGLSQRYILIESDNNIINVKIE